MMTLAKSVRVLSLGVLSAVGFACGGHTSNNLGPPAPIPGMDAAASVDATPHEASTHHDAHETVDSAAPPPAGYPAPHSTAPQVAFAGGPVLAAPKIIPIVFPNEALSSQIQGFVSGVGATGSAYWLPNVSQYGVGAATGATVITLTEAAPSTIDDSQIPPWLSQEITAGTLPAPDANTIYAIFYPSSTTITLQGATSCQTFGGYHNDGIAADGTPLIYAVLPRCSAQIESLTAAASHEFIEASTDPQPSVAPAYPQVDNDDFVWEALLGGGEVCDLCAQFQSSFFQPAGFGYLVQRCWSNSAAAAGQDPCAPPLPGEVYFNAAPVLSDAVTLMFQGQSIPTKGVSIPIGQSATIEVDLFSDAPTSGPWSVQALDSTAILGGSAQLTLSLNQSSGQNGDKLELTITPISQGQFGGEAFVLLSQLGNAQNFWFGFVGN
jgi:hypothetical protein